MASDEHLVRSRRTAGDRSRRASARRAPLGLLILSTLVATSAAQQSAGQQPVRDASPKPLLGTAVVSGVVVTDEPTPVPVRRARVTLRVETYGNGWSATTDDDGRFVMRGVTAG